MGALGGRTLTTFMPYDPQQHHRRSLRLATYDYRQAGAYFVTVCTNRRLCLLGSVIDGTVVPNDAGRSIQTIWDALPDRYPGLHLDVSIVMPNHMHGILVLDGEGDDRVSLGTIIGTFKSLATRAYIQGIRDQGWPPFRGSLWQRNYYEHVIRSESELDRIRLYVVENATMWERDTENPALVRRD